MAEETVKYKVEIDDSDVASKLQDIRSQLDSVMSTQIPTGEFSSIAGLPSTFPGLDPTIVAPPMPSFPTDAFAALPGADVFQTMSAQSSQIFQNMDNGFNGFIRDTASFAQTIEDIPNQISSILPGGYFPSYSPLMPFTERQYDKYVSEQRWDSFEKTMREDVIPTAASFIPVAGLILGPMLGELGENITEDKEAKKAIETLLSGKRGGSLNQRMAVEKVKDYVDAQSNASDELYKKDVVLPNLSQFVAAGGISNEVDVDAAAEKLKLAVRTIAAAAHSFGIVQEEAANLVGMLERKKIIGSGDMQAYFDIAERAKDLGIAPGAYMAAGLTAVNAMQGSGITPHDAFNVGVRSAEITARIANQNDLGLKAGGTDALQNLLIGRNQQLGDLDTAAIVAYWKKKNPNGDETKLTMDNLLAISGEIGGRGVEGLAEAQKARYDMQGQIDYVAVNQSIQRSAYAKVLGREATDDEMIGIAVAQGGNQAGSQQEIEAASTIAAGGIRAAVQRSKGITVAEATDLLLDDSKASEDLVYPGDPTEYKPGTTSGGKFGASREGGKRSHKGFDMFVAPGKTQVIVRAAHDGTVIAVDDVDTHGTKRDLGGKTVTIKDSKTGYESYYAHLSEILVQKGQQVKKGDPIGRTGDSGNAQGMINGPDKDGNWKNRGEHLHFQLKINGGIVDPETAIDMGRGIVDKGTVSEVRMRSIEVDPINAYNETRENFYEKESGDKNPGWQTDANNAADKATDMYRNITDAVTTWMKNIGVDDAREALTESEAQQLLQPGIMSAFKALEESPLKGIFDKYGKKKPKDELEFYEWQKQKITADAAGGADDYLTKHYRRAIDTYGKEEYERLRKEAGDKPFMLNGDEINSYDEFKELISGNFGMKAQVSKDVDRVEDNLYPVSPEMMIKEGRAIDKSLGRILQRFEGSNDPYALVRYSAGGQKREMLEYLKTHNPNLYKDPKYRQQTIDAMLRARIDGKVASEPGPTSDATPIIPGRGLSPSYDAARSPQLGAPSEDPIIKQANQMADDMRRAAEMLERMAKDGIKINKTA